MHDDIYVALDAALYALSSIPNKQIDYAENLRTTYALTVYIKQVIRRHSGRKTK